MRRACTLSTTNASSSAPKNNEILSGNNQITVQEMNMAMEIKLKLKDLPMTKRNFSLSPLPT